MAGYFGTDGFRGEAGVGLTAHHAFLVGRILGSLAVEASLGDARPAVLIGRDTRHSGTMIESALAAGLCASGADAHLLGVVTTPGVAYLTRTGDYAFGIMVSASHNPFYDNGIKILNANGEKLAPDTTDAIEGYLSGTSEDPQYANRHQIGIVEDRAADKVRYQEYLLGIAKDGFAGYRIALDCANGSASELAPAIFRKLGAEIIVTANQPDGLNINEGCGSTHIESLKKLVVEQGCDLGFAYDGDADRCLAVDGQGDLVDGDAIMFVCARHLKGLGKLTNDTVVTTVMSNFGLYKAFDEQGLRYEKTQVGDKYVYENMVNNDHALGGEQSGHVIFREFATTGDGILTSLMVMEAVISSGKTLFQLKEDLTIYPQVLENVRVQDKDAALEDEAVRAAVAQVEESLGDFGRVLVRKSGTECLVRVMVEAEELETCRARVQDIIDVIEEKGHTVS